MIKTLNASALALLVFSTSAMASVFDDVEKDPREKQRALDKAAYKNGDPLFKAEIEGHMKSKSSGSLDCAAGGGAKIEASADAVVEGAKKLVKSATSGKS